MSRCLLRQSIIVGVIGVPAMLSRLRQYESLRSTTLATRFRQASEFATRLAMAAADQRARFAQFIDAETLIAALPIAADEYACVRNRLRNALQYYEGGESGAASYELRLLAGLLKPPPLSAVPWRTRTTQT
jgi:hypothetical protein